MAFFISVFFSLTIPCLPQSLADWNKSYGPCKSVVVYNSVWWQCGFTSCARGW